MRRQEGRERNTELQSPPGLALLYVEQSTADAERYDDMTKMRMVHWADGTAKRREKTATAEETQRGGSNNFRESGESAETRKREREGEREMTGEMFCSLSLSLLTPIASSFHQHIQCAVMLLAELLEVLQEEAKGGKR